MKDEDERDIVDKADKVDLWIVKLVLEELQLEVKPIVC